MTEAVRWPVSLRPVDLFNWQYCIALELAPEQAPRLASNLYSIAEARVQPRLTPWAIYAGEMVIGFAMTEYLEARGAFNIPRFMIDRRWQGAGYGGAALAAVIERLAAEQAGAPILISITPDNHAARGLYESRGFVDTGERLQGEIVLRRD